METYGKRRKPKTRRIIVVPVKIQTEHKQNMNLERYRYDNSLGIMDFNIVINQ
jgi:hypothetical protein